MKNRVVCQACAGAVIPVLDLGQQPITSHFLPAADVREAVYELIFGQCIACGLAQLVSHRRAVELRSPFDWFTYREPEDHLDEFVDRLIKGTCLGPYAYICGVTIKDDSILERFRRRGFNNVWRIDPTCDLDVMEPNLGVETVQELLVPEAAERIVAKRSRSDVVIVRHVLEHAFDLPNFINGLRTLLKPDGYLVVEVPDCTAALEHHDYTTIWEEHSCYFTPTTLANTMQLAGFEIVHRFTYQYPIENSLILVMRIGKSKPDVRDIDPTERDTEIARVGSFGAGFGKTAEGIRRTLESLTGGGKAAIFGAGHLAAAFVNYHRLAEYFDYVVDDNHHKQGLFMPGSRLWIRPSSALSEGAVKLALTCFAPENENKVIARNSAFINSGGRFLSVFPTSERAIHRLL